jgi:hypothetical protein
MSTATNQVPRLRRLARPCRALVPDIDGPRRAWSSWASPARLFAPALPPKPGDKPAPRHRQSLRDAARGLYRVGVERGATPNAHALRQGITIRGSTLLPDERPGAVAARLKKRVSTAAGRGAGPGSARRTARNWRALGRARLARRHGRPHQLHPPHAGFLWQDRWMTPNGGRIGLGHRRRDRMKPWRGTNASLAASRTARRRGGGFPSIAGWRCWRPDTPHTGTALAVRGSHGVRAASRDRALSRWRGVVADQSVDGVISVEADTAWAERSFSTPALAPLPVRCRAGQNRAARGRR